MAKAQLFLEDRHASDLETGPGLVAVRMRRNPEEVRSNEDAAAVIPIRADALVLAVADGVGGAPSGCLASAAIVESLRDSVGLLQPDDSLRGAVLDALERANTTILASGTHSASTVVVAAFDGTRLRCFHIGDSELFVVGQRGRIKHRIVPHSPTGFAVAAGLLDEVEAMYHDQRHVIFNVVGNASMHIDVSTSIVVAPLDTVLLCSDGVSDNLFVEEIVEVIRTGPLDQAADQLLEAACARMAAGNVGQPSKPDDVTIVLFRRHRQRRS